MKYASILLAAVLVSGCTETRHPASAPAEDSLSGTSFQAIDPTDGNSPNGSPVRAPQTPFVRLDVWHLSLPFGTVSRNEEFWKRVNEQCVDVATYDLLYKNGIRVGEAPTREWEFFKSLMEQHPALSQKTGFTGNEMQGIEMEMLKSIDSQTLFVFDANNTSVGRTYEHCDNLFTMSFQAAPRKPGQVRIAMCPVVRAVRKRLEFTVRNEEREIRFVNPERLYDLNLRVDVPLNSFLIIAPSEDSWRTTSAGRAFLVKEGLAERFEEIILIVPQPFKMEDVTASVARGSTTRE